MDKPIKNTITGLLASTIILSQLSGISALAMEDSETIVEEESTFVEPTSDELIENDFIMDDYTDVIVEEEVYMGEEEYTDMEYEDALLEEDVPLDENINLEEDGYQEYDNNYNQLSFEDLNNFTMTTTSDTITPETTVHFSIEVDYDSPVIEGDIGLDSDMGYHDIHLNYNEATNRLEGSFSYSQAEYYSYGETIFVVGYMTVFFENGSYIDIYSDDYNFSNHTISIDEESYDNYEDLHSIDINEIDHLEIIFEKNTIEVYETIKLSLNINYDKQFHYSYIYLESDNSQEVAVRLHYNMETELYEGEFTYDPYYLSLNEDRLFKVKELYLEGENQKYLSLDANSNFITDDTIKLVGADYHYDKPIIDTDSFKISSNQIIGDDIQFSLDIISDVEIQDAEVRYISSDGEYEVSVYLEKFRNSDTYFGELSSYYHFESDTSYHVDSFHATDMYGNSVDIPVDETNKDWSYADISTHNYAIPTYDRHILAETINLSTNEVTSGNYVEYSADIDSDGSNFRARLILVHEDGYEYKTIPFAYDENDHLYKARWDINDNVLSGEWRIEQIILDNGEYGPAYGEYLDINLEDAIYALNVIGTKAAVPKPKVSINDITVSEKEVAFGDTIKIAIDMDIESQYPIASIYLLYSGEYVYKSIVFDYNSLTQQYEASFTANDYYDGSELNFNQLFVETVDGQTERVLLDDIGEMIELTVKNVPEYPEEFSDELLNLISIETNVDKISANENVTVSVELNKPEGIDEVSVYYRSPSNKINEEIKLMFNPENDRYEGIFETDKLTESGIWKMSAIAYMTDTSDYEINYGRDEDGLNDMFRMGDFRVEDGKSDLMPPSIDLSTLNTNGLNYSVGETVDVSIKVTDSDEISDVTMYYRLPKSGYSLPVSLTYNSRTMMYEGTVTITDTSESGKWLLSKIIAVDELNNSSISEHNFSLSKGNIIVANDSNVETVMDIIIEDFSVTYDDTLDQLSAQTTVTHPELVHGVMLTYMDLTTLKQYTFSLSNDVNRTQETDVLRVAGPLFSIDNQEMSFYTGSLVLKDDINPENLKLIYLTTFGESDGNGVEHRSSLIDPTLTSELTFGDIEVPGENEEPDEDEDSEQDLVETSKKEVETKLNIDLNEFKISYDKATRSVKASLSVNDPDNTSGIVYKYLDNNTDKVYDLVLTKKNTKTPLVRMASFMTLSSSTTTSNLFEGELVLPEDVNSENLELVSISVIGLDGNVTEEVFVSEELDLSFGDIVNAVEENDITLPVEEESKPSEENKEDTDEETNNLEEDDATNIGNDNLDTDNEIESVEETLTDKDKAETGEETDTDNNNVNQEENIAKDESQSSEEVEEAEEKTESEKDTDDEKIKQESNDEVFEKTTVTDSSTEEEIENDKLPQTGSSRSTGLIVSGWLSLAAGISLIGSKVFKRKLKD